MGIEKRKSFERKEKAIRANRPLYKNTVKRLKEVLDLAEGSNKEVPRKYKYFVDKKDGSIDFKKLISYRFGLAGTKNDTTGKITGRVGGIKNLKDQIKDARWRCKDYVKRRDRGKTFDLASYIKQHIDTTKKPDGTLSVLIDAKKLIAFSELYAQLPILIDNSKGTEKVKKARQTATKSVETNISATLEETQEEASDALKKAPKKTKEKAKKKSETLDDYEKIIRKLRPDGIMDKIQGSDRFFTNGMPNEKFYDMNKICGTIGSDLRKTKGKAALKTIFRKLLKEYKEALNRIFTEESEKILTTIKSSPKLNKKVDNLSLKQMNSYAPNRNRTYPILHNGNYRDLDIEISLDNDGQINYRIMRKRAIDTKGIISRRELIKELESDIIEKFPEVGRISIQTSKLERKMDKLLPLCRKNLYTSERQLNKFFLAIRKFYRKNPDLYNYNKDYKDPTKKPTESKEEFKKRLKINTDIQKKYETIQETYLETTEDIFFNWINTINNDFSATTNNQLYLMSRKSINEKRIIDIIIPEGQTIKLDTCSIEINENGETLFTILSNGFNTIYPDIFIRYIKEKYLKKEETASSE